MLFAAQLLTVGALCVDRSSAPPFLLTQLPKADTKLSFQSGSRLILVSGPGQAKVLTDGFYAAADPDLSFDARTLVFAGRKASSDPWQIFEMNLDGTGLRQLTHGETDCRQPIYERGVFNVDDPAPSPQVVFTSAPSGSPALFSIRMDGSRLRQLTFHPGGVQDPAILWDGRVVYSMNQAGRSILMGINQDGTDVALLAKGPSKRMDMAAAAGERQLVFVEGGPLAALDLDRPLTSRRVLTLPADGAYYSPSSYSGNQILVSHRATTVSRYSVVRYDLATRTRSVVYDDPEYQNIQARLVTPRRVPDGRGSVVDETAPNGRLYCLNVYNTNWAKAGTFKPGTVKKVRVLEAVGPGPDPQARLLGESAVEPDGSFHIEIPANTAVKLQVLDDRGLALKSSSWIWVKNKENRGCIGCHEDRELSPENRVASAIEKPAARVALPESMRRQPTLSKDVMPILDKHCSSCHGPKSAMPIQEVRLKAWTRSEARLSPLVWSLHGTSTLRPWDAAPRPIKIPAMPPPPAQPLTDAEKQIIQEWLDLGGQK